MALLRFPPLVTVNDVHHPPTTKGETGTGDVQSSVEGGCMSDVHHRNVSFRTVVQKQKPELHGTIPQANGDESSFISAFATYQDMLDTLERFARDAVSRIWFVR